MAFPTGAVNGQEYTSKFGTYYYYSETENKWVKKGVLFYGSTGVQGPVGQPGLTGTQGATGVQGDTGTQGEQGIAGPTGGPGSQGTTGIIGETGVAADGPVGYYGSSTGVFGMTFDGNESYLVPGIQMSVKIPHNINVDAWEVVSHETGYITSDINVGNYSIWPELVNMNSGSTGPYISNNTKNKATGINGWSETEVSAGDYVQFLLTGVTGVKNATISIEYHRI